jgi:sec-independent protein translocase protein TatA
MASLPTTATVVRPGLARGKASAPKAQAPKSCAMSGLTGSAPAFLGKPSALSAGIVTAGGARGAGSRSVATMGLFGLGLPELVVIGGVAAVLFGPSKLPELGKSLGKTVKSFQAAANVRTRPHPRACDFRDPHVPTRASFPSSARATRFRDSRRARTRSSS